MENSNVTPFGVVLKSGVVSAGMESKRCTKSVDDNAEGEEIVKRFSLKKVAVQPVTTAIVGTGDTSQTPLYDKGMLKKSVQKSSSQPSGTVEEKSHFGKHILKSTSGKSINSTQTEQSAPDEEVTENDIYGRHNLRRSSSLDEDSIKASLNERRIFQRSASVGSMIPQDTESNDKGMKSRNSWHESISDVITDPSTTTGTIGPNSLRPSTRPKSTSFLQSSLETSAKVELKYDSTKLKKTIIPTQSVPVEAESEKKTQAYGTHVLKSRRDSINVSFRDTGEGGSEESNDIRKLRSKSGDESDDSRSSKFGKHLLKTTPRSGSTSDQNSLTESETVVFGQHQLKKTESQNERKANVEIEEDAGLQSFGFDNMSRRSTSYSLQRLQSLASEVDAEPAVSASFTYHHHTLHANDISGEENSASKRSAYVVAGSGGSEHLIENEEANAFSVHINHTLRNVASVSNLLPLTGADIFSKNGDGLIILSLIHIANPLAIDMSKVNLKPKNLYQKAENLNLALKAAQKIGCHIVNIGTQDLIDGRYVTSVVGNP